MALIQKKSLTKILDAFTKVETELEQFIVDNGTEIDKKEKELAERKAEQSRATSVLGKIQQLLN